MPTGERKADKRNVNAWLDEEDRGILKDLARMLDTNMSEVLRISIHRLYEAKKKELEEKHDDTGNGN